MPLYEYECESCANRFEKIQKFSDPLVEVCDKCGGKVRKLFSSPAIQFKGSGWYINDYAKKSSSDTGKSSGGRSEGASDTKDKSTDKSAEKSESSATKTDSTTTTPKT